MLVEKAGEDLQTVQFSDKVARGCWSSADCMKSSTLQEVKAIRLVVESYSELLTEREGGASPN